MPFLITHPKSEVSMVRNFGGRYVGLEMSESFSEMSRLEENSSWQVSHHKLYLKKNPACKMKRRSVSYTIKQMKGEELTWGPDVDHLPSEDMHPEQDQKDDCHTRR